jgi:hypothetical protein
VESVSDVQHTEQDGEALHSAGSLNGLLTRLEHYDRDDRSTTALDEPLTPELALVDPELRRRARAQLPDKAAYERPRRPRVAGARTALSPGPSAAPAVRPAPARLPPARVRRSSRGKAARRLLVLVILAAAAAFAVMRVGSLKHVFWKSRAATVARANGTRTPTAPESAPKAKPRNGPTAPPKPDSHAAAKPATPAASPPRTFVWPPVTKADYYLVVFSRRGAKIFRARPSSARLVLPERWTFHGTDYTLLPGRYSWVVRPGYGPRARNHYGPATVRANLVIQSGSVG